MKSFIFIFKTHLTTYIALLSVLIAQPVFANSKESTGTRGGGNALVCFDDPKIPLQIRAKNKDGNFIDPSIKDEHIAHINKIELLDVYEAKLARGMDSRYVDTEIVMPNANESIQDYAIRILNRAKEIMPDTYELALNTMKRLPANSAIIHDYGIEHVNDYNLFGRIDSKNCVIGTVATNLRVSRDTFELHIDGRLLNHPLFSKLDIYVTYLHEIIYRTLIEKDSESNSDSQSTRRLVKTLIKKNSTIGQLKEAIKGNIETPSSYGVLQGLVNSLYHLSKNDDLIKSYILDQATKQGPTHPDFLVCFPDGVKRDTCTFKNDKEMTEIFVNKEIDPLLTQLRNNLDITWVYTTDPSYYNDSRAKLETLIQDRIHRIAVSKPKLFKGYSAKQIKLAQELEIKLPQAVKAAEANVLPILEEKNINLARVALDGFKNFEYTDPTQSQHEFIIDLINKLTLHSNEAKMRMIEKINQLLLDKKIDNKVVKAQFSKTGALEGIVPRNFSTIIEQIEDNLQLPL